LTATLLRKILGCFFVTDIAGRPDGEGRNSE